MKVLVVEDSIVNLEILSLILQAMGYDVMMAENGQEGYRLANEYRPSLIIVDYHLPGMNGIELVHKIRQNNSIAHIPIIAMTADIYAKNDLLNAGCDAYLAKPIRKGSLLRTITQVLATAV
ncbi:MAG: response regulator [Chloroflexota bacterium]